MARAEPRGRNGPLANRAGFLEAEISLPVIHGLTDDP